MTRDREKLLIGILAGVIITGAAAFAIQPALADKAGLKSWAGQPTVSYEVLNLRLSS